MLVIKSAHLSRDHRPTRKQDSLKGGGERDNSMSDPCPAPPQLFSNCRGSWRNGRRVQGNVWSIPLQSIWKLQPIDIALGCLPELEVPIAEDGLHFRHRTQRIWVRSDLKASSLRTTFHSTKSAVQDAKGWKQQIVLSSCDAYEPQQWPEWQDIPKDTIVQ